MKRHWTLATAQELFPEVRQRTAKAVEEVLALLAQLERLAPESVQHEALETRIQGIVSLWAREMDALGLEVKGAWLVDFDCGAGYYCWKWPEERLEYFHSYTEGFAGRSRIQ